MRKTIQFSKFFVPALIISILIVLAAVGGYFFKGGFNLGVDFRAGLIQEVQFAPTAFGITWEGNGNASVSSSSNNNGLDIIVSGVGVEARTHSFLFNEYPTVGALRDAMLSQLEGLDVDLKAYPGTNSTWIVLNAQGNPQLGSEPFVVHYLDPASPEIRIETVREAMSNLEGRAAAVQNLGRPSDRHFMIRVDDKREEGGEAVSSDRIVSVLEGYFGAGEVVVLRSDYVGSRFSKNLSDQAGVLVGLTLLIMLLYVTVRFKPQYGIALVLGIINDGIVIVAFVIWTGMEFNTTTIAALLTILGYSTNNTIVVFDRVRENLRILPDESYVNVLNISLTATLNRTIITTLTTMLAVISLFIFTTGAMKDFALALLVGMTSGVYTTTFIASGFVYAWDKKAKERAKRNKLGGASMKKQLVESAVDSAVTSALS